MRRDDGDLLADGVEIVDFSSAVFVDTTGLVTRKTSGVKSLAGLAGKKVGVVSGTTNQTALEAALKRQLVGANVVAFKNRAEALAALESGSIDAFAGDKVLLLGLGMQLKDPAQFEVLADDLGFEPYAIALPRNDSAFRLAVNRGLAQVFRSEAIAEIFRRAFGPNASPTLGLRPASASPAERRCRRAGRTAARHAAWRAAPACAGAGCRSP